MTHALLAVCVLVTAVATSPILHGPTPPAAKPLTVTVDATRKTHTVNKHYLGCHSDSGYTHQPRGFYSQMIVDASFEDVSHVAKLSGWNNVIPSTATATVTADNTTAMNGGASQRIIYTKGTGSVGVANRGLGNEGLLFGARTHCSALLTPTPTP